MNDIRSKLYLRLLIRLTEKFGSKQHGNLIKQTFDKYLVKNPVIDNDTFLKVETLVAKKLEAVGGVVPRKSSLSPLNRSVEMRKGHKTSPLNSVEREGSLNDYE